MAIQYTVPREAENREVEISNISRLVLQKNELALKSAHIDLHIDFLEQMILKLGLIESETKLSKVGSLELPKKSFMHFCKGNQHPSPQLSPSRR
jgi:hypothetical protein